MSFGFIDEKPPVCTSISESSRTGSITKPSMGASTRSPSRAYHRSREAWRGFSLRVPMWVTKGSRGIVADLTLEPEVS